MNSEGQWKQKAMERQRVGRGVPHAGTARLHCPRLPCAGGWRGRSSWECTLPAPTRSPGPQHSPSRASFALLSPAACFSSHPHPAGSTAAALTWPRHPWCHPRATRHPRPVESSAACATPTPLSEEAIETPFPRPQRRAPRCGSSQRGLCTWSPRTPVVWLWVT